MAHDAVTSKSSAAQAWLTAFRRDAAQERDDVSRRETVWSLARLGLFIVTISLFIGALSGYWLIVVLALGGAASFRWAVSKHTRLAARRAFLDQQLLVAEESARRLGGHLVRIRSADRPSDASDPAAILPPFLDASSTCPLTPREHDDLDLYRIPHGLFGMLNRTSTSVGCRRLRDMTDHLLLSVDDINRRQAAVRWLDDHPAERVRLMASATPSRLCSEALDSCIAAIREMKPLPPHLPVRLLRVWSAVGLLLVTYSLFRIARGELSAGMLLTMATVIACNAAVLQRTRRVLADRLAPWLRVSSAAEACLTVASQAALDLPREAELGRMRESFARVLPREVLPRLCRVLPWADAGGVARAISNLLLLYDLHLAAAIAKCVVPHRDTLLESMSALAELDAWTSLACFSWEQPVACYPVPGSGHELSIEGGRHALIEPRDCVPNTIRFDSDKRLLVITGSNASGKSTFLRMIGTNVVLAQIGAATTAERMSWQPLHLLTDLRVQDSLSKNESYFVAETRQLRRMVFPDPQVSLLLGLVDEPFRGTNSTERVAAGIAITQYLLQSRHFFAIATHDEQLTRFAGEGNYHFREEMEQPALVFDYRLYPGIAQTHNALRILEAEGYPPELLAKAHEFVREKGPE